MHCVCVFIIFYTDRLGFYSPSRYSRLLSHVRVGNLPYGWNRLQRSGLWPPHSGDGDNLRGLFEIMDLRSDISVLDALRRLYPLSGAGFWSGRDLVVRAPVAAYRRLPGGGGGMRTARDR